MAGAAIVAAAAGAATLLVMQFLPAVAHLNPVRTPLSDYVQAGGAAAFDVGVGLLAVGVVAVGAALTRFRHARDLWALGCLSACGAGLVVLTVFPDAVTPSGGPTTDGWLHLAGCLPAFVGPPAAALRLGHRHRRRREAGCSLLPRLAGRLGIAAIVVLVLFAGMVAVPGSDVVGAVERGLASVDIAIAIVLAVWAWRGCSRRSPDRRGHLGRAPHRARSCRPAPRARTISGHRPGCRRPRLTSARYR